VLLSSRAPLQSRSQVISWLGAVGAICASLLAAVGGVAATTSRAGGAKLEPLRVRLIRAPAQVVLDDPHWFPALKQIAVTYEPADLLASARLYSLGIDGRGLHPLPISDPTSCRDPDTSRAFPLGAAELAFVSECRGMGRQPDEMTNLEAYDPRTRRTRLRRPYHLPLFVGHFTFRADGLRGLINDGYGLKERLRWLLPDRLSTPLKLPFERAGYPAWSPDGRYIAVDAVTRGKAVSGVDRLDLPRELYLLSPTGRMRRTLASKLTHVGGSAWSPNGRWLALACKPEGRPEGLYLVQVETRRLYLVLPGRQFGSSAWIPGTRQLVTSVGVFSNLPHGEELYGKSDVGLYVITLPALPS
jgi:hypothetical protein